MTRTLNTTTKVRITENSKGYKVQVLTGEFAGKTTTMSRNVAIALSPRSRMNPRAVGQEAIRRFKERAS